MSWIFTFIYMNLWVVITAWVGICLVIFAIVMVSTVSKHRREATAQRVQSQELQDPWDLLGGSVSQKRRKDFWETM